MPYRIVWQEAAVSDLKALSPDIAKRITKKVEDYLSQSPQTLGKPLSGSLAGFYRFRMGDWRVIYKIVANEVKVVVVRVGHRRDIYDS